MINGPHLVWEACPSSLTFLVLLAVTDNFIAFHFHPFALSLEQMYDFYAICGKIRSVPIDYATALFIIPPLQPIPRFARSH
jgi:hypothetical protein